MILLLLLLLALPPELSTFLRRTNVHSSQDKPLPPDPDQAAALKLIKDVFKAELAKKTPADQKLLAKKMIEQGRESKDDPATQYVLFREARELAVQAGDLPGALEAIDEIAKRWTVDAGAMRTAALMSTSKSAKTPDEFAATAAAAVKIADGAVARDDYDTADKVLATGLAMAKKAQDAPLAARIASKSKEAADLRTKFNGVRRAREVLEKTPDDPASNAAVGRYLVLLKGDWAAGLPHLAKGGDEPLKSLAATDLAAPVDPAQQNQLGDGWWELAEKEPASKDLLHERGAQWYAKALPKLTGLSRTKAEKRVQEVNGVRLAKGAWVNVTDPKNFNKAGRPGESIEIKCNPGFQTHAIPRELPKGEFDAVTIHLALDPAAKTRAFVYLEGDKVAAASDCGLGVFAFAKRDGPTVPWGLIAPQKTDHPEDITFTVVLVEGEFVMYVDNLERARFKTAAPSLSQLTINIHFGNATVSGWKLRKVD